MPERKKTLYVITKSVWGGAQKYVFDLATNLPKDRFEAVVAAGGAGPLFDKLRQAGVRTIAVPGLERDVNIWKELRSFRSLLKIFREEKPDIIHLNSSKSGGLGALAAFIYKFQVSRLRQGFGGQAGFKFQVKVIFTVHGWGFKEIRPFWQRTIIFLASAVTAFLCTNVITISTADYLSGRKFIPRSKLHLVFLGLVPFSLLPGEEAKEKLAQIIGEKLDLQCITIGAIAELTPNKGLEYLLDALQQLKFQVPSSKFQAILIGNGELKSKLKRQIEEKNLPVFLPGFIPDARQYLKALDIFALPSLKEGLPYSVMEAMSAGVPVVATQVGGLPDLIESGVNGLLVEPKNSRSLALALQALIGDNQKRKELGRRAAKTAQERFSFPQMLEKTLKIYDYAG